MEVCRKGDNKKIRALRQTESTFLPVTRKENKGEVSTAGVENPQYLLLSTQQKLLTTCVAFLFPPTTTTELYLPFNRQRFI